MIITRRTVWPPRATADRRPLLSTTRISWLLPVGVLIALGLASVLSWGSLDQVLAGGDVFPATQLNPGKWFPATLRLWTTAYAGGGDIQYGAGNLLSSALEIIPRSLGMPAALLLRAEFGLVVVGTLLSAYVLPRELGLASAVIPRLLGSIAFSFSLAVIQYIPDIFSYWVFFAIVSLPLFYARFLKSTGINLIVNGAVLVVGVQILAYVVINPPRAVIIIVQVALVCLYIMASRSHYRRDIARTALMIPLMAASSGWWIISAFYSFFNSTIRTIAVTDISSWSWTHVNASLLNVWRFVAGWAWPHHEYYPWSSYYDPAPLQVAELWPMASILIALLLWRRGTINGVLFWSVTAITSAFLAKGLHSPLTGANLWLYQHVPGFFLFREPVSKFDPSLDLASTMLLVIVLQRGQRALSVLFAFRAGTLGVAGATLIALAWPAITGLATADSSERLAPMHVAMRVRIPGYWNEMAAYVNQLSSDGSIAILPNDDYYQMLYTWGYYGTDVLPQEVFNRPVFSLYDSPQGYASAAADLERLNAQLIAQLHDGDASNLPSLLGAEGVRYVLLRHDVDATMQGRRVIAPSILASLLAHLPTVTRIHTEGQLDLYEIAPSLVKSTFYGATKAQVSVRPSWDKAGVGEVAGANGHDRVIVSEPASSCQGQTSVVGDVVPTVTVLRRDLDGYTVRVAAAQAPTLLVLNQSFNPGWTARIEGSGNDAIEQGSGCAASTLHHVKADGFANAWWIPDAGETTVRVTYGPQMVANVADAISGVGLTASVVVLLLAAIGSLGPLVRRSNREASRHSAN